MNEAQLIEMVQNIATLKEKVEKLELLIYGVLGFAFLQLGGLFVLWMKHVYDNKK